VLKEGQIVTERELQAFVASRAADFKVPKKILFMDEIPKGATGKLQRIGLAAKLGLV
jgi:acyl-coenzyme A synthetase/AMP-(fatty) acid ligase